MPPFEDGAYQYILIELIIDADLGWVKRVYGAQYLNSLT
jgi:hypothetical protein